MTKITDKHDILTLVVPTNEPDTCKEYFLASIHNMKSVAPITTIAFNFQRPWTYLEIDDVVRQCTELGFRVVWKYNGYKWEEKGHVPFNQIRYDAAKLVENSLFYALTDDDFKYRGPSASINKTAGDQYVDIIHYLVTHPQCGLVLMGGTMYKKVPRNHIGPCTLENTYITGRGYVMRSLSSIDGSGLVLPDSAVPLVGSDEEKIAAGSRLSKGYYPAKMGFSRTSHYEQHASKKVVSGENMYQWNKDEILEQHASKKVVSGENMYQWNKDEILENNANKYIRENYNPRFGGKGHYNVANMTTYLQNGGLNLDDADLVSKNTVNYESSDPQALIDEIVSIVLGGHDGDNI